MEIGKTVGRLRLVEKVSVLSGFRRGKPRERIAFKCECECGTKITVLKENLVTGHTSSCGCFRASQRGLSSTPEYAAWDRMKKRCAGSSPHHKTHYKERGISIDPRWLSFENFLADMGRMPNEGLTLERVENDKGYGPDNCRWATWHDQRRNRRDNRWIEIDGVRRTLTDWALELKIPDSTLRNRLNRGMEPKLALGLK